MLLWAALFLALLLSGPLWTIASGRAPFQGDWRTASHSATGLAPDPAVAKEAIVQVYAARAFGWRGAFGVHTWLAAKAKGADQYTRYEVIGWYAMRGQSALSIANRQAPDAEWFGARPTLLADVRGLEAEHVIAALPRAVATYPYADTYRVWPGPNSNTFIAHLGRAIPELRLTLPPIALGKDYLPWGEFVARTPSGSGYQFSLGGLIGVAAARDEGFELNVLGLVVGLDVRHPAVKVPGIGRLPV